MKGRFAHDYIRLIAFQYLNGISPNRSDEFHSFTIDGVSFLINVASADRN